MRMIEDNRILSCGNIRRYIKNKNIISNYTQLEYIQNTGTQWIDTGVYPNQTIKIQIELTCYGTTGGAIIGNDTADDNNDYRLFNYTDNHWYYDFKDQRCIDGLRTVSLGTKYLLELGNNYIKDVNSGTILVSGSSISQFSSSTSIFIFKATGGASYTLHSLKMWLNNVLVRNYIPCIDNFAEENMNVGLYDKVTKTFTCGTGYFYAGPEISGSSFSPLIETEDFDNRPANMNYLDRLLKDVKNNYTKLEYIAADGTQYIELDYVPSSETSIECEFSIDKIFDSVESNKQPLYGSSEMYNKNAFEFWPQAYGFSCYDSNSYKTHTGVKLNEINHVVHNKNVLTVNDTVSTFTYKSFTCPKNLTIFATNRSSQGISIFNYEGSVLKLFYLKISENGNVLHDLIPAYLNDTNEPGLYDLIDGKFYQNKNTGTSFIAGEVVNDISSISNRPVSAYVFKKILSNIKTYTELQWIEGTGQQWIDTEVIPNENTVIRIKFMGIEGTGDALVGFMTEPNNDDNKDYRLFNHQNDYLWYWDIQSSRLSGGQWKENTVHNVEAGNNYLKNLDTGQNILSGNKVGAFTTTYTIRLLKASDSAVYMVKARIYSLEILQGSTSVRNYIPVKMNDGNIGLYDLVNSEFYGSQGPSAFVAGPEI